MSKIQELLCCSSVLSVLHLKLLELNAFPYIYFENQTKTKFIMLKGAVKFIWREEKKKITFGFLLLNGLLVTNFLNEVLF